MSFPGNAASAQNGNVYSLENLKPYQGTFAPPRSANDLAKVAGTQNAPDAQGVGLKVKPRNGLDVTLHIAGGVVTKSTLHR